MKISMNNEDYQQALTMLRIDKTRPRYMMIRPLSSRCAEFILSDGWAYTRVKIPCVMEQPTNISFHYEMLPQIFKIQKDKMETEIFKRKHRGSTWLFRPIGCFDVPFYSYRHNVATNSDLSIDLPVITSSVFTKAIRQVLKRISSRPWNDRINFESSGDGYMTISDGYGFRSVTVKTKNKATGAFQLNVREARLLINKASEGELCFSEGNSISHWDKTLNVDIVCQGYPMRVCLEYRPDTEQVDRMLNIDKKNLRSATVSTDLLVQTLTKAKKAQSRNSKWAAIYIKVEKKKIYLNGELAGKATGPAISGWFSIKQLLQPATFLPDTCKIILWDEETTICGFLTDINSKRIHSIRSIQILPEFTMDSSIMRPDTKINSYMAMHSFLQKEGLSHDEMDAIANQATIMIPKMALVLKGKKHWSELEPYFLRKMIKYVKENGIYDDNAVVTVSSQQNEAVSVVQESLAKSPHKEEYQGMGIVVCSGELPW